MDREMRDDERYPTVVQVQDGSNAPEVAPYQTPLFDARDKVATPVPNKSPESAPIAATFDDAGKEVVPDNGHGGHGRRICGMKRRTFFIVAVVVAVVVIAAIVGGVVGGLKAGKKSDGDDAPGDAPEPIFTGPIGAKERQLAVTNSNTPVPNIQLFYNDLATTDILYRRIVSDKSGAEHKLDLAIAPNWGSPLAASAWRVSNPLGVQIFYITNATANSTNSNTTNIAQATINCSVNGTEACDVTSNSVISTNITESVHASSKLSSLRLSPTSIRVYFQAANENLLTMVGDDVSKNGWTDAVLQKGDDAAFPGSYFSVVGPEENEINAWYVVKKGGRMKHFSYRDVLGPKSNPTMVDDQPGSGWAPTASFSGIWISKLDTWRAYWTSPTTGSIVSYSQDGDKWAPASWDEWGKAESGIAATSWNDQIRLYYFQSGDLVMNALNATAGGWTKPKPV